MTAPTEGAGDAREWAKKALLSFTEAVIESNGPGGESAEVGKRYWRRYDRLVDVLAAAIAETEAESEANGPLPDTEAEWNAIRRRRIGASMARRKAVRALLDDTQGGAQ